MGLIVMPIIAAYLAGGALVAWLMQRWAKKRGRSRWWGGATLLVIYGAVYWDMIPTYLVHGYYCVTEAGYTQYKTLAQWKRENPGVAETLVPDEEIGSTKVDGWERYRLNQRFAWDTARRDRFLSIGEHDNQLVDTATGEVLARYSDFNASPWRYGELQLNFWDGFRSCAIGKENTSRAEFFSFKRSLQDQG